jgi:hypothetical protein
VFCIFVTTDYLKKIENLAIPENTTLVTLDVTSLYANIPHDDAIAAWLTQSVSPDCLPYEF